MCLPPVSMDIIVNQLMKICEQKQKSWWHKHIGVQNSGFLQCKISPIFKVSIAQSEGITPDTPPPVFSGKEGGVSGAKIFY